MAAPKKRGRKPKYSAAEDMQAKVDSYFAECVADKRPPTVSGLAYHLGMSTEAFRNYEAKDDFLATVKRAKQRVEIALEERLDGASPTGAIFNLKNNFGWKDTHDHSSSDGSMSPKPTVIEIVSLDDSED